MSVACVAVMASPTALRCDGNVLDECGVVAVMASPKEIATVTATSLTSAASVAVKASLTARATGRQRP